VSEQRFNVPLDTIGHFRDDFYRPMEKQPQSRMHAMVSGKQASYLFVVTCSQMKILQLQP